MDIIGDANYSYFIKNQKKVVMTNQLNEICLAPIEIYKIGRQLIQFKLFIFLNCIKYNG